MALKSVREPGPPRAPKRHKWHLGHLFVLEQGTLRETDITAREMQTPEDEMRGGGGWVGWYFKNGQLHTTELLLCSERKGEREADRENGEREVDRNGNRE